MGKMTAEGKHLYSRYVYNSVVEFVYFIILYLETYETASSKNVIKYVKFFKAEVDQLISSFKGKTFADKLTQMLKILGCFKISENEIRLDNNMKLKNIIFEDFVISKCVDLLLKKQSSLDNIYENINLNSVIKIKRQDLPYIIKKYSYISVCEDQTVILHHFHGLVGFEGHIYKTVIGYFHEILQHNTVLSYEDMTNHIKSLSLCGLNNIIEILCILYYSEQFICQDGNVYLNTKSEKHLKQRPIHVAEVETNVSSRSMLIGQIVFAVYGSFLHHWIGEIGTVKKHYGIIYCVVDFTDGHQGVFNIYFSKTALKVISELDDLDNYVSVRDVVEFDAEYYNGKMIDRCWKATRVKLYSNKLKYDEILCDKLNHDTELERSKCSNNKSCTKIKLKKNIISNPQNVTKEISNEKHMVQKTLTTSDYDSCSSNDSYNEIEIDSSNSSHIPQNQITSTNLCFSASKEHVLDYLCMFGYIYMLMDDKGLAIAKHGDKFYNILFMKDSVYTNDMSNHLLLKGQKIFAVIPFFKNFETTDSVCIPILVYGLNEKETDETEKINMSPEEFSVQTIFCKLNSICNKCYEYSCSCNSLHQPQQFLGSDLRYKIELNKLHNFMKSQYRLPFNNDMVLFMLQNIGKDTSKDMNLDQKVFKFFRNLVKFLPKNTTRMKMMRKNKRKNVTIHDNYQFDVQRILEQTFCFKTSKKRSCSETDMPKLLAFTFCQRINSENCLSSLPLAARPNSLLSHSQISFSSYKTCSTNDSEIFYSCESKSNSPEKILASSDNGALDMNNSESLLGKINTVPEIEVMQFHPTLSDKDEKPSTKSNQCRKMKVLKKYINESHLKDNKYLLFQSITPLKCSSKNRKRTVSSCSFKMAHKSCLTDTLTLKATVSLISDLFIFFSTNIKGHNIILPFPKEGLPSNLLENVKLNTSCEITIAPDSILNLSHILKFCVLI